MFRFLSTEHKHKTGQALAKTRQAWFGRLTTLFRARDLDQRLWDSLEEALIASDVGVQLTIDLIERVQERVIEEQITEPGIALALLKNEMVSTLELKSNMGKEMDETPLVILVVGVNGVGKTTSIAKLADLYRRGGHSVLLGAADTFRAAAIEQLEEWGGRVGVDVISHNHGGDPGAVAYDAVQAAKARGIDIAIIDTAGRLQTKTNLMEELRKVHRVVKRQLESVPPQVLLTLDATTGQNGLLQARSFSDAVKCDGVFLAKLDGTAKGGIVLAVAAELSLPVIYIGTGEQLHDIAPFNPQEFVDALFIDDYD